jgi:NTE family protein
VRAVASSCAIPGFFPPVRFGDHHYIDGPRGGYMAALAKEKALDAILFIGPNAALPAAFARQVELEALADDGLPVVLIEGGDWLASIGMNLMDPRLRAGAAEAGLADARVAAGRVKSLLG